jgi:hypothetical protein
VTYTNPGMRERIKNRIMAGSKGGKPGQWSARKAQLLAAEYKKSGGGYSGGKTKAQKSLSKWTGEKWRTSDGSKSEGKKRYLPDKAWKALTPAEKRATNAAKAAGNRKGKQFVAQPKKVAKKAARFR